MKKICILGMAILLAACSSHRVHCRGALQPINKPAAVPGPPTGKSTGVRP